jgi:hypothetical protein
MPGAGLSGRYIGKTLSEMPAFQPYWGKPAVRNDRGDGGNVGIIRSPLRASVLPDCGGHQVTDVPTATSSAVVKRVKNYEVRSYIPEKKQKGRRHWQGQAEEQQAVYQNRRRVRGEYGKSLLRRRGELVERSFAHCYDTGGMRRTHLRGHKNILKRQLIHVGAFNLSLMLRQLLGAGTPREWRNRGLLVVLVYWVRERQKDQNLPWRPTRSSGRANRLNTQSNQPCRWPCRKSATYATGC